MLSKVLCFSIKGINARLISVEVDLSRGLPSFNIVGLPDKAIRESRERVRAAINNSGFDFPIKKITINLAPADLHKIGPHYDLAIAVGILAATGNINPDQLASFLICGELSLNGNVRTVKGILPAALRLKNNGINGMIVPVENYREAALVKAIKAIPVQKLGDVINFFNGGIINKPEIRHDEDNKTKQYKLDFNEIKGQEEARRALEVAASGRHNILMIGPPGTGKTMLARRLRTILPPLTEKEALELTKIYSTMGMANSLIKRRPFRSPHQSISQAGLIGGGRIPAPGEVSLAYHGTLFLDELPEFKRSVLELLRQPLEKGEVTIIRSQMTATFPAEIMLVAAMNPCPCGYYGDERHECSCSVTRIKRYRQKISAPLLDRIDIHIEVPALEVKEITEDCGGESSTIIKERVIRTQQIQLKRYQTEQINYNSQLKGKLLPKYCQIDNTSNFFLENAVKRLGLSARAYDRILRMSRTIADMEGFNKIKENHIAEAVQYRSLNRTVF